MCTVTLIPIAKNDFILTSNRDEMPHRKTIAPQFHQVNETRMLFPQDMVAGGTWIGVSDTNTMICLLNGGFKAHESASFYEKSRGVVVKDLLEAKNLEETIHSYNYTNIEPFTIVAASWQTDLLIFELVWDGRQKHVRTLQNEMHIWSSSTLYTNEMKSIRKKWFKNFQKRNDFSKAAILDFHKHAGVGDKEIDLLMDRGGVKTISITQIVKQKDELQMRYENLQNQEVKRVTFEEVTV
ncbi:NRDE family protein [Aquimarina sp. U1-2]|uniref:NRDE family protein n=1 Tax=Aquimarina sp. U1-2 TaxID=2823141 RepID=UPI001AEC8E3F|nr:NRDE family protein [Aquimarina sp. U1-2]MBP2834073.1 NRDE family protein [Aquimarina sp. U1-2]